MRKVIASIVLLGMLNACSTSGGWYSESDPQNNEFSGWKTAGAVVLGVLTLGAVAAGAAVGASQPTHTVYTTPSYSYSGYRTYYVNGEMVTCYHSGSFVNCY